MKETGLLYEVGDYYVVWSANKKSYEVYQNGGTFAKRVANIGLSLGLERAIHEANKRHESK